LNYFSFFNRKLFMFRLKLNFTIFLFVVSASCFGEIIPSDGSKINYTDVYFQSDLQTDGGEYVFSLYSDADLNELITHLKGPLPAFWVPGLSWGHSYYWKITALSKDGKELAPATIHHFSVLTIVYSGADEIWLDVKTNKKGSHSEGLISIDYTRCLYARAGNAVWTFPEMPWLSTSTTQVRDLKITKDNTVTFFNDQVPTEMDVYGNILWTAPYPFILKTDTILYHHNFTKTKYGTYVILGNKKAYRKVSPAYTAEDLRNFEIIRKDSGLYCKVLMTVLLEFNKKGELTWFWDSDDYIKDVDLNYKKKRENAPIMATHSSAFSLNEAGTKIYVSFRDLSRIIKLDKKTKKVELSYGEKLPSGDALLGNSLFRKQQDVFVTRHNSFLVFNSNVQDPSERWYSSVLEVKENPGPKDSLLLWKMPLNFDGLTKGRSFNGGNVMEVRGLNLLICTGSEGRIFEVKRSGEIVWDALVKSRKSGDTTWQNMPQYRSSWVTGLKRYYFITESKGLTTSAGMATWKVNIHNTGNADDSYQVQVLSEKNAVVCKTTVVSVKNSTEATKILNFKHAVKRGSSYTLVVTSVNSGRKSTEVIQTK